MGGTRAARRGRFAALVIAATALLAPNAFAATITVTTTVDVVAPDGQCSLREAIAAADTDAATGGCPAGSGADTVSLGAATYGLALGQLQIDDDMTLAGAGAAVTTIKPTVYPARVIEIAPAGAPVVTIKNLEIAEGHPIGGDSGGDASGGNGGAGVPGGGAPGGSGLTAESGGGVLNRSAGRLTLDHVTVYLNHAGDGGAGGTATGGNGGVGAVGGSATGGSGGAGAPGGGVYTVGPITVVDSTFSMNQAGAGGTGGNATGGLGGAGAPGFAGGRGDGGAGGAGGSGGAIAAESTVTIESSVFENNDAGNGGVGGFGHGGNGGAGNTANSFGGSGGGGTGGSGGAAGAGGAVHLVTGSPTLTVTATTFRGNRTLNPGAGGEGRGGNGGQGFGTGVGGGGGGGNGGLGGPAGDGTSLNWPSTASITRSLFHQGQASIFGGTGGAGQGGGGGPAAGVGGAGGIAVGGNGGRDARGTVLTGPSSTIVNSTFANNHTGLSGSGGNATGGNGSGGNTHGSATGGNGGNGGAGAIHALGTLALTHDTFAANIGGSGGNGGSAFGSGNKVPGSAGAVGPGVLRADGNTTLTASILSANTDPYCSGTITNGGHNIAALGCPGTVADPEVGTLADNGGPTKTLALGSGSAALDIVPVSGAGCQPLDQRAVARPHGAACDAGAYERAGADAATNDATGVSTTAATLNGSVTPNGHSGTYHFEYGTTTAYGTSTPSTSAGAVSSSAVGEAIGGLSPQTTYHFRLVASSSEGTGAGADRTFTTAAVPAGGGDAGPGPGGGASPDTTAPLFEAASVRPRIFAVNRRGKREVAVRAAARRIALGTLFRFKLSEPARVVFTIARVMPGRKVGKRCVKPTRRNARRRPCKRYVVTGRFAMRALAGANTKRFSGRIGRRALSPRAYRATLVATDAAGNASKPKRLSFRVVRVPR